MHLRMLAALAATVALASCGGGGGDSQPVAMMTPIDPPPVQEPSISSVQANNPQNTQDAAADAANNLPIFGSVTQSSNHGSVAGISGDAASVDFNGVYGVVRIQRTDGSSLTFDSRTDTASEWAWQTDIPGHTDGATAILEKPGQSATVVGVSWDNTDPTDYLAGGYWVHLDRDGSQITGAEFGAFVDGPEISVSSPPNLPVSGTASYLGEAEGIGWQTNGSDTDDPGGQWYGIFSGTADLRADFSDMTISGCVGCIGDVVLLGRYEDSSGRINDVHTTSAAQVHLGPAPISQDGSFRNRAVSLTTPDFNITSSSGAWGGQFSNIPDASGDPRLVAGTFGGESVSTGGTESAFVGAYYATK